MQVVTPSIRINLGSMWPWKMRILLHKGLIDSSLKRVSGRGDLWRRHERIRNVNLFVRDPYIFFANCGSGCVTSFFLFVIWRVKRVGLDPLTVESTEVYAPGGTGF